ncbi:hypothetical protein GY45DRAFT_648289 [Cubamyces sp. BRFM 1775]|nr:hypothetical protein GY45DRAFT_648289 [Cubamyces sp. BRFM 1775]
MPFMRRATQAAQPLQDVFDARVKHSRDAIAQVSHPFYRRPCALDTRTFPCTARERAMPSPPITMFVGTRASPVCISNRTPLTSVNRTCHAFLYRAQEKGLNSTCLRGLGRCIAASWDSRSTRVSERKSARRKIPLATESSRSQSSREPERVRTYQVEKREPDATGR